MTATHQVEKPTSAPPKVVMGVTFRCYPSGILQYEWRSDDARLVAWQCPHRESYRATVDGKGVFAPGRSDRLKRFRTLENAMRAAVVRS